MFRSWPSDPLATCQPPFSGPTRFSAGTRTSLKKTSLKSTSPSIAHRGERPPHHAGQIGRDHQHADALVLGGIGISANESQEHIGVVGARRPHLLPVDHELVAIDVGAGAQRREVGARARLTHSQRRGHFGPQDRHRPAPLLLGCAERDQRRGDDADALRVEGEVAPAAGQFLLVDVLLQDRGVAATELGRIPGQQPAVVEHQPLPAPGPVRDMAAGPRTFERLGVVGQMLVEERDELRAEGLDVSVEGQLHSAPGGSEFW